MKRNHNEIQDLLENKLLNVNVNIDRSSNIDNDELNDQTTSDIIENIDYIDSFGVNEDDSLYFFRKGDTYYICSSNDQTSLILAEFELKDGEEFSLDNCPENFKDIISSYASYIEDVNNDKIEISEFSASTNDETANYKSSWKTIPVLMQTKWSQYEPFSKNIVIDTRENRPCVTGCNATAIAQIIAYWGKIGVNGVKYKIGCKATPSYTSTVNSFSLTIPSLSAIEQFDYDNLTNEFQRIAWSDTSSSNLININAQAGADAVATLMQYVSYAIHSNFSFSDGTSNSVKNDVTYMKSCLYFNSSLSLKDVLYTGSQYAETSNPIRDQIELTVYNELLNQRPVLMASSGTSGAHTYVCDGYNKSNDAFHLNIGWGGSYDGYYKFSDIYQYKSGSTTTFAINYNKTKWFVTKIYPQQYIQDIINGDFNGDGTIDINDIEFLQNAISDNTYIPDYDLNDDGYIDIKDVRELINKVKNKGLINKFNLAINGTSLMNDQFNFNTETNYMHQTINVDKNNGKVKIITKKRGSSGIPLTTETAINLPTITNPVNNVTSLINNKSTPIRNTFNTYVNTLSNRYANNSSINAIKYLNINKNNYIPVIDEEYIDLGLSVKWASRNLGAENPEDVGYYYSWGEISTKSSYTSTNYTDNDLIDIAKNNSHDAAYHLNNNLCMPSLEQIEELINKCVWTKITKNNKLVWEIVGPNGNIIYLPVSGYKENTSIKSASYGYYWTSIPHETNAGQSYLLQITNKLSKAYLSRYYGMQIRPIKVKSHIEFVNLGLPSGTKWGNMNLGADLITEYGNYYRWGELKENKNYVENSSSEEAPYSYSSQANYGNLPTDICKDIRYDAAYAIESQQMCLPTATQMQELVDSCTWTKMITPQKTVIWRVQGPNGNSIDLPIFGCMHSLCIRTEDCGYYWTGSKDSTKTYQYATALKTYADNTISVIPHMEKYYGCFIRPVQV